MQNLSVIEIVFFLILYRDFVSLSLNLFPYYSVRIAYKYYNKICCQILSDNFFVYKINRRRLPFSEWFQKFHSAQCFIHTFTRKGSSRRLNIYDCRGISTTVIPPALLYSDIQTRHPCDCKSPEQYLRGSIDLGFDFVCNQ